MNQIVNQNRGATWQPFIGPRGTLLFAKIRCHVSQIIRPSSTNHRTCHVTCQPHHLYHLPHQHCTALPRGSTACPVSILFFFFTCLARRTDLDNFSIRTPFAKINIPPESGERDGRNGTIFVAFRAL
jgi:hypothetical protein